MEAQTNVEVTPSPNEATFVKISRHILNRELPKQVTAETPLPAENSVAQLDRRTHSFNLVLDELNRQVMETPEGLRVWTSTSEKNAGVGFLATHLTATPDLTDQIARDANIPAELRSENPHINERIKHEVFIIFPALGLPPDGSGLSSMDLQIARVFNELPKVADGATVDVLGVGVPDALGGKVTQDFVDRVRGVNGNKYEGFKPFGEVFAEYAKEQLTQMSERYGYTSIAEFIRESRVVFQGVSRGTVLADLTYSELVKIMPEIVDRTEITEFEVEGEKPHEKVVTRGAQREFVNPAGEHGHNPLEQAVRSYNLAVGMGAEIAARTVAGGLKNSEFSGQKEFYAQVAKMKGIEDSSEQKKLKGTLFLKGEILAVGRGTPLDKSRRSYVVQATPDSVNTDIGNLAHAAGGVIKDGLTELGLRVRPDTRFEPHQQRRLSARQDQRQLKFGVGYIGHNYLNLLKGFESGSFNQKMAFVERRIAQKQAA